MTLEEFKLEHPIEKIEYKNKKESYIVFMIRITGTSLTENTNICNYVNKYGHIFFPAFSLDAAEWTVKQMYINYTK